MVVLQKNEQRLEISLKAPLIDGVSPVCSDKKTQQMMPLRGSAARFNAVVSRYQRQQSDGAPAAGDASTEVRIKRQYSL